jgi:hypothetical protein
MTKGGKVMTNGGERQKNKNKKMTKGGTTKTEINTKKRLF